MKRLLYCIFDGDAPALAREWGGRVELFQANGLYAAFSRTEEPLAEPTLEKLREYERVVAWLHARRSVIPLRYGNVLDSDVAVADLLARRGKEFRELLARIDGKTELGLRILFTEPPAGPLASTKPPGESSPGKAYLRSIRERLEREGGLNETESRLADRIREAVRRLDAAVASELRRLPAGRLLSLSLLLPKENVEECRRCLLPFVEDPALKALVTGPWPPYNSVAQREVADV